MNRNKLVSRIDVSETIESAPDFSQVPLDTLCRSIQLLIDELNRRGIPIRDFDQKHKCVRQIKLIKGKPYFLAEEESHG